MDWQPREKDIKLACKVEYTHGDGTVQTKDLATFISCGIRSCLAPQGLEKLLTVLKALDVTDDTLSLCYVQHYGYMPLFQVLIRSNDPFTIDFFVRKETINLDDYPDLIEDIGRNYTNWYHEHTPTAPVPTLLSIFKYVIDERKHISFATKKSKPKKLLERLLNCTYRLRLTRDEWVELFDYFETKGYPFDKKNSSGTTPLMVACEASNIEAVAALITKGANVNNVNSSGLTPLLKAVKVDNLTTVGMLLEAGADIDKTQKNSGKSALELAVTSGNTEMVKLLKRSGANMLVACEGKNNPFFIKSDTYGKIDFDKILSLLELAADSPEGLLTAMLFAIPAKNKEARDLLEKILKIKNSNKQAKEDTNEEGSEVDV